MLDDGSSEPPVDAGTDANPTAPRVRIDGGSDAPDGDVEGGVATPPGPCHLVERGAPFHGVSFADPAHAFTQSGLLARSTGAHVVQYGPVSGVRTGTWQDPPIFAAEYDVSSWPPSPTHEPTQLFHSMHMPADLIELPSGKLALSWWFDNDGPSGPMGIRFRTLDASSWALDADHFLAEGGSNWTRPEVGVERAWFASAYRQQRIDEAGARYVYEDRIGVFDFDGEEQRVLPLWELGDSVESQPLTSMRRTESSLLLATAFGSCEGVLSPLCEPRSLRSFRVDADGLHEVAAIPTADPSVKIIKMDLLGDGSQHTWLTWWEADALPPTGGTRVKHLLAQPLTADGALAGPLERWHVEDAALDSSRAPASIGALGVVYPVSLAVPDAGSSLREVHLLHRQLDQDDALESLSFTTPIVSVIETVQLTAPRRLLVGYSTRADDGGPTHGELRQFVCREDQ